MTYNAAALAAYNYIQRHPPYDQDYSPPNGKAEAEEENERAIAELNQEPGEDADSPPGGAAMERQPSHATRSTRAVNHYATGFGVDAIGDLNYPGNMGALVKHIPKLPPAVAFLGGRTFNRNDLSSKADGPFGLSEADAHAEFEMIRKATNYNSDRGIGSNLGIDDGGRSLLAIASDPLRTHHWVSSSSKEKWFPTSSVRDGDDEEVESAPASVAMSRQPTGDSVKQSGKGRIIKKKGGD